MPVPVTADAGDAGVNDPDEPGVDGGLSPARPTPQLLFQYSVTIDDFCTPSTVPETLTEWQRALIGKIPQYRPAPLARLPTFQKAWDESARDRRQKPRSRPSTPGSVANTTRRFTSAPGSSSMGTPLGINVISYLDEAVPDIPTLTDLDGDGDRDPLPAFLLVAITYHELLHKYLAGLDVATKSEVLDALPSTFAGLTPRDVMLLRAHLHLFALRRRVYEGLGKTSELSWIAAQEAGHGAGYKKAWQMVHEGDTYYVPLLEEIRRSKSGASNTSPSPEP